MRMFQIKLYQWGQILQPTLGYEGVMMKQEIRLFIWFLIMNFHGYYLFQTNI